jgi:hypothetical protein
MDRRLGRVHPLRCFMRELAGGCRHAAVRSHAALRRSWLSILLAILTIRRGCAARYSADFTGTVVSCFPRTITRPVPVLRLLRPRQICGLPSIGRYNPQFSQTMVWIMVLTMSCPATCPIHYAPVYYFANDAIGFKTPLSRRTDVHFRRS